jgi:MBG domain (YGX type)
LQALHELGGFLPADGVTAAYSRTAGETVASSPYTIGATRSPVTALSNYTVVYNTANFNIAKATLTVTADNKTKILNATNPPLTATTTGFKNGETLATSGVTGSPLLTTSVTTTSPVASYPIYASLGTLGAANYAFTFAGGTLSVTYAPVGSACYGDAGHQILQPINPDGGSVFKQKSTVPAKFRVCDVNGNSIGTPGVVTSFVRYYSSTGTTTEMDELVDSTTPDTAFRWSSSDQQWIFNISTKSLSPNMTYHYRITINDGSTIEFRYGLK